MSSARRAGAAEDSILASLERGSSGSTKAHRSWLIIGGSVAALLTLMIAWLAYSNATSVRALPPSAVKRQVPEPLDDAMRAQSLPSLSIPAPQAAAIVDEPAAPAPARPALVMLPRDDIAKPEEQAPVAVLPAEQRPSRPAPVAKAAPAPRHVAKASKAPAAKAVAKAVSAKKPKAPAAASKSSAPEVDSDVALISAILAHSTRHAAERAQMEKEACAGKKCAPKASTEP